jgi:ferredoxin--NADP+ reductase
LAVIANARRLNADVTRIDLDAPHIAAKALPGQFVVLRVDARGERIPLTIARADAQSGVVTVVVQRVGKSTAILSDMKTGDIILDVAGPLGTPTHLQSGRCAVVGGGLGCAIAWPIAAALKREGAEVHMIAGFRTKDIVILEEEMREDSSALHICTDDGSYGFKGFVTDKLKGLITGGVSFDRVYAIGPLVMMKFVSRLTKEYGIPTVVSMNPLMVDGTGMCGCCRVTVDGKVFFACVDGPDFDGHLVDFDETMRRNTAYAAFEKARMDEHICRLTGESRGAEHA